MRQWEDHIYCPRLTKDIHMKKTVLVLSLIALGTITNAQFAAGAQVNLSKFFGAPSFIGLGANASYAIKDKLVARLSVNFGLPKTESNTSLAYALSSDNPVRSVNYTYEERLSLLGIWIDGQYFFTGDYEDGGLYGLVGIGYTIAKSKFTVGPVDRTRYGIGNFEDGSTGQAALRLGAGYEHGLDFGNLFGELGLNLSANQQNGVTVATTLPSFFFVNVGFRHYFD